MRMTNKACAPGAAPAERRRGAILGVVMIMVLVVALMGTGIMALASQNAVATARALNSAKAFWLAEAGVQRFDRRVFDGTRTGIGDTLLGDGTYRVEPHLAGSTNYAICIGNVRGEEQRIRIDLSFLAPPFEHAVFAGNETGAGYTFELRGTGVPQAVGSTGERYGRDSVNGNVYANGDVALYEQSRVNAAPAPNTYNVRGDVDAVGGIAVSSNAAVAGDQHAHVLPKPTPEFPDYSRSYTYDVAAEFARYGITSGYLPSGHALRDVVVKNPSDRLDECRATVGDDYFFEPRTISGSGTWKQAVTPLNLGNNRIYYVNGHVWFNNHSTYGFRVSGTATIVATADMHVSDNLDYANTGSLLGLVAVGQRDLLGTLRYGNVYFGDPEFGTLYSVDAFMFAAKDFLYNTYANTGQPGEPTSGFQVFGNYSALNQVKVYRDWYGPLTAARPAAYDAASGTWKDALNGNVVTNALRHYQMTVSYDERIRNQATQPPGLPQHSAGAIYGGITRWDSLSLN